MWSSLNDDLEDLFHHTKQLIDGVVPEHGQAFVAAELPRRGYVATLTLRNTRGIDVLASNADATKSVGMQVKTCQGVKPDWILTAKAERRSAENLCYVSSVYRIVVRRRSTSFRGTSLRSRCVRRMNNGRRSRVVTDFRTAITRSVHRSARQLQRPMGSFGAGLKEAEPAAAADAQKMILRTASRRCRSRPVARADSFHVSVRIAANELIIKAPNARGMPTRPLQPRVQRPTRLGYVRRPVMPILPLPLRSVDYRFTSNPICLRHRGRHRAHPP
jgi:hypothetical protein